MAENYEKAYNILMVLKRVQETMRGYVSNYFKELNLTAPQGMVVFILFKYGSLMITELSEKIGLSNSTISGIVDRLEKQGFVKRRRSEEDRRVVKVFLTDKGENSLKEHKKSVETLMADKLSKASEDEMEQIIIGLKTLDSLMHTEGDKGDGGSC